MVLDVVKKNLKHKLAFTDNGSDHVRVHGLIGVNIIQFMDMKIIKCMNGKAWGFPTDIAPLVDSHHFLYQEQIARARAWKSVPENNYQTIIAGYSSCPEERVNFVLTPKKTYPDAFSEFFNESSFEHNLEKMFDVDSFGSINEKELVSDYDKSQIKNNSRSQSTSKTMHTM